MSGLVAIVGRPNVGKSTLFNFLTRSKASIVSDQPGITRDRLYGNAYFDSSRDSGFLLVDTGGFETKEVNYQPFGRNLVWQQTEYAIDEADLVILMFDGKTGLHPYDRQLVSYLQKKNKDVLYVVNKIDGQEHLTNTWDFHQLGVAELLPLSAAHKYAVGSLLTQIRESLAASGKHKRKRRHNASEQQTKVAIIGRPNAGKSSILNRLIGEERSIVSDVAGTTRDRVDSHIVCHGQQWTLIDTAGVRRRSKVKDNIEIRSVFASIRAIEDADVIVYTIDATQGLKDQDIRLLTLSQERYKPVLLVVNKWDLVAEKHSLSTRDYIRELRTHLPFSPVLFISCHHNQRVQQIFPKLQAVLAQHQKRASTAIVNQCLSELTTRHPHPLSGTRRVKFFYATQQATTPPTFVVMCNTAKAVLPSYKRYMEKSFREKLGFQQVPIKLLLRNKTKDQRRA